MLPLECRVGDLTRSAADDPMRWSDMVVSPLADLPVAEHHGVRLQWTEGTGLRVDPQAPGGSVVFFAPFALAQGATRGPYSTTSLSPELSMQLSSEREGEIDLYWTDEGCPAFSPACSRVIGVAAQSRQTISVRLDPELTGHALRLKLVPRSWDAFTIRFLMAGEAVEPSSATPTRPGLGAQGPDGLIRSDSSGRLHWALRPGERLTCDVPDGLAETGRAPRELQITVPGGQRGGGGPRVFEFRAYWVSADGEKEAAGELIEGFDRSSRRNTPLRLGLKLRSPSRPPEVLQVELLCVENCGRGNPGELFVEVDRPWGRARGPEGTRKNLILVVVDTLRADHLSTYGYERETDPHTASWAKGATVYERVYSADTWTLPGHAALFTGRYPLDLSYQDSAAQYAYRRFLSDDYETLAEVLQQNGYRTIAYTDPGYLAPPFGLDQGFEHYDAAWEPFARKIDRALQSARDLVEQQVPFFIFLHTYEVHEPYSLGSSSDPRAYDGTTPGPTATWRVVDWARQADSTETVAGFYRANYDESIRRVDAALAPLYGARDVLDGAVLCVTSDHGEALFDQEALGHGGASADPPLTWIPLVLSGEAGRGRRHSEPLSQTAIPRILIRAMGLDLTEGRLAPVVRLPAEAIFAVRNPLQDGTLNITGYGSELQLLQRFDPETLSLTSSEVRRISDGALLYEAQGNAPLPMRWLQSLEPAVRGAQRLARRWAELHRAQVPKGPPTGLDREDEDMLEALGYVQR